MTEITTKKTREDWLREAAIMINKDILAKHNTSLPEFWDVSVGFPYGNKKAIGQAWDRVACDDEKTFVMFISPILHAKTQEDIVRLLATLLHEVIHISVGIDQGHSGDFKRVARAVGLEGRITATYAPEGSPLAEQLLTIARAIGYDYPHVPLRPKEKPKKERAKNFAQYVSTTNPEYIVKIKKEVVKTFGIPFDPQGVEMELKEEE